MKNYLIYCTANEKNYAEDFLNLVLTLRKYSGVPIVEIIVVISKVFEVSKFDQKVTLLLKRRLRSNPKVQLLKVIFKSNIGRDFSSVKVGLSYLSKYVNLKLDDTIMVRNRSSFGPLSVGWYSSYKEVLESKDVALVGNTINFSGLPSTNKKFPITHVQTYVYLSSWKHLLELEPFPGINETEWEAIINHGEIALSQMFFKRGYSITCLQWPDKIFNLEQPNNATLPQTDIKEKVKNLPFLHRRNRRKWMMRQSYRIVWFIIRLRFNLF